jgi:hypothetical protein
LLTIRGGGACTHVFSWGLGTPLGAPPLVRRMHSFGKPPLQANFFMLQTKEKSGEKRKDLSSTPLFQPKVTTARIDSHQILRLHIPWQKVSPMSSQIINL